MHGLEGIIVGAASVLGIIAGLTCRRVRDESAIRVRDDSATVEGVHDGRPSSDRDQGGGVRDHGIAVEGTPRPLFRTDVPPPAARGMGFLPASEHADRFIDWLIYDEDGVAHTVVMSDVRLFANYLFWADRHSVVPLPAKTLQTLLGKRKPQVGKDRPIKKCPKTGRALYLATGSPDRWTRYTINPPRAVPALPGKVPVTDVVAPRPMETKAQRETARAAQSGQPAQPMRRAA